MCYVIELRCCAVSLCYVAVFVVSVLCTVCHCVLLCQCVMSVCYVTESRTISLCRCVISLYYVAFFSAVSLFFNVLCTVLCQRDWISLCRSMSRLVSQYAIHRMSMYYVSETGYHYVVVCRAWSVSMLCTVCQCTMSARLDIIMSLDCVAVFQTLCYSLFAAVATVLLLLPTVY